MSGSPPASGTVVETEEGTMEESGTVVEAEEGTEEAARAEVEAEEMLVEESGPVEKDGELSQRMDFAMELHLARKRFLVQ